MWFRPLLPGGVAYRSLQQCQTRATTLRRQSTGRQPTGEQPTGDLSTGYQPTERQPTGRRRVHLWQRRRRHQRPRRPRRRRKRSSGHGYQPEDVAGPSVRGRRGKAPWAVPAAERNVAGRGKTTGWSGRSGRAKAKALKQLNGHGDGGAPRNAEGGGSPQIAPRRRLRGKRAGKVEGHEVCCAPSEGRGEGGVSGLSGNRAGDSRTDWPMRDAGGTSVETGATGCGGCGPQPSRRGALGVPRETTVRKRRAAAGTVSRPKKPPGGVAGVPDGAGGLAGSGPRA